MVTITRVSQNTLVKNSESNVQNMQPFSNPCAVTRQLYLKDRFNFKYLILRFGYPAHLVGTNICRIVKTTDHTH